MRRRPARGEGRWRYAAEHLGTPAGTGRIHPFSPEGAFWIRGDTAYVYDGHSPVARKVDKEGRPVGSYPLPENPLPPERARRALEDALEQLGRDADFSVVPRMDRMGRIADVIVDDLGFTWAKWYDPGEDSPWLWEDGGFGVFEGGTWALLDHGGDVRATIVLPRDFQLRKVRGAVLAGVTQDELGVQRVLLYQLTSERPQIPEPRE